MTRDLQAAAVGLGLQFEGNEIEINQAFATFRRKGAGVLVIGTDTFFAGSAQQIGALSIRHSMPTIFSIADLPRPAA